MANPPAAILGADELLAPLEDGGLGAAYQRASSAGSGSTGRPARSSGHHWRPRKRGLSRPDTATCFPEQRNHVAPDCSRESSHRVEGDVLVAGFDQRDLLLCQAGPLSQLSLRQASLNSGRTHIPAENLPQTVGNGRIALGRFPAADASHAAARPRFRTAIVWALLGYIAERHRRTRLFGLPPRGSFPGV